MMRWLKVLVVGMGVAIVIGLTVVIVVVAQRADEPSHSTASGTTPPAPPVIGAPTPVDMAAPLAMLADSTVEIPTGAVAEEITSDHARLIIRLRLTDGRTALLLIDVSTGKKLGLITLENRASRP